MEPGEWQGEDNPEQSVYPSVTRVALSWSSGKDSAWTLHTLQRQQRQVSVLVTTVNRKFERVAMHAVRRQLLQAQAEAAGIRLIEVPIPYPCSNEQYDAAMRDLVAQLKTLGIQQMAFGDLYLEDVRRYREDRLHDTGIEPLFPLWGMRTRQLAEDMIDGGLRAVLTTIDPEKLSADFCGRQFDQALLRDLPNSVDPCGENGEFHSFAYNGPMFRSPVAIKLGEQVERDGYFFSDILPAVEKATESGGAW
jgi:uncharacterized protein (TIGR00290 family)